ncbi:MAG: extracellular solute-binding protein [Pseudomonadota bacterium]
MVAHVSLTSRTFSFSCAPALRRASLTLAAICFAVLAGSTAQADDAARLAELIAEDADGQTHAMAMHGSPAYPPDFAHFDYVNPDAPQGGAIRFGLQSSFDSVNPLIPRGTPVWWVRGLIYESLGYRTRNEAFTMYGLLAEQMILPEDRASVTFVLNPDAAFSDGEALTVDDVIFSMELLREHGRPSQRRTYGQITGIERIGGHAVRFELGDGSNKELPLILALMPILPEHAMTAEVFTETSLEPPVGSGPYRLSRVDVGRLAVFERNESYWGADLPSMRGQYNVDEVAYEYFRDETALFESFKRGTVHLYSEGDPVRWVRDYDFPAALDGRIVQSALTDQNPKPAIGYVFNTRREIFADVRVRQALTLLFDFQRINQSLFVDQYARTEGYFFGSDLSAIGEPASDAERAILAGYEEAVLPDVMDGAWRAPVSDGSGQDRAKLREALGLLREAGWTLNEGTLVNQAGDPFTFELLTASASAERVALSYAQTLELLGIEMTVRVVDSAQDQARRQIFDYDMIPYAWYQSLSPGNEQRNRFGPSTADVEGSWNMAGVSEPGVGVAIDALVAATTRDELVTAARALDRLLISGSYMIPHYHAPAEWIAHASQVHFPETRPVRGYQFYQPSTIWVE